MTILLHQRSKSSSAHRPPNASLTKPLASNNSPNTMMSRTLTKSNIKRMTMERRSSEMQAEGTREMMECDRASSTPRPQRISMTVWLPYRIEEKETIETMAIETRRKILKWATMMTSSSVRRWTRGHSQEEDVDNKWSRKSTMIKRMTINSKWSKLMCLLIRSQWRAIGETKVAMLVALAVELTSQDLGRDWRLPRVVVSNSQHWIIRLLKHLPTNQHQTAKNHQWCKALRTLWIVLRKD